MKSNNRTGSHRARFYQRIYNILISSIEMLDFSNQAFTARHLWHICKIWESLLYNQQWPNSVRVLNLSHNAIGVTKVTAKGSLVKSSTDGLRELMKIILRTKIVTVLLTNNTLTGMHLDIISAALQEQETYYLNIDISQNPIYFYQKDQRDKEDNRPDGGVKRLFQLGQNQGITKFLSMKVLPTVSTIILFEEKFQLPRKNRSLEESEKIRSLRPVLEAQQTRITNNLRQLTRLFKQKEQYYFNEVNKILIEQNFPTDLTHLITQYIH